MTIPNLTLNNGIKISQLGLGVWKMQNDGEVEEAVLTALEAGYRLIDTAAIYGNEQGVGRAIAQSGIPREELFITTKLWNSDQGKDKARTAFESSLERLGLDYVDLYLIHWPAPSKGLYVETWKELEKINHEGLSRAIGVSNFKPTHLDALLKEAEEVPSVNQIELHPQFTQKETREFCSQHEIKVESYSPLGGTNGNLLENKVLKELAAKHVKTPAQIILRWHVQQGLIVIPKSVKQERIVENMSIFDFELTDDDMEVMTKLDTNIKIGADPDTATF